MNLIKKGDRVKIVWAKDVPSHDAKVEQVPKEGDNLWYLWDMESGKRHLMALNPYCSNFAMFIKVSD